MSARLIVVFAGLIGLAWHMAATAGQTPAGVSASNMTLDVSKLRLASANALVFDVSAGQPIYAKGADTITPIASVTKLMTAMVVLDADQALDETISVGIADLDLLKGSHSRLRLGSELSRREMLHLALMASEIRDATTTASHYVEVQPTGTVLGYNNTNSLVRTAQWDIQLSKTGFIREAGKCLVMLTTIASRPIVIVLLDSVGKLTRIGDANRVKYWLETGEAMPVLRVVKAVKGVIKPRHVTKTAAPKVAGADPLAQARLAPV